MKLLTALLVLAACVLGFVLLLPLALAFVIPLGWLILWLLPIVIILFSDRTSGGEKLAWILLIVFFSWFAWIFYFLLAPLKPRFSSAHRYRGYRSAHRYRGYRYE